ncbi:anaerobic sulfatase maturase [uncultured Cohaesibacter sp.]|uniref:anaerobic sulfatase maturase n=1 Tax=uncultured Cohaesibacter sp. TaxID=1002546 RepID=UPI00292FD34A|nr:anaerobic sulfatase maturase [uncultured Cohaesibacter sp.]
MSRSIARRPFHLMAKPTGFRCNIACDYCFYLQKDAGTLKSHSQQRCMDDETLEAYVRSYIEASPETDVDFVWQGGEPTMAGVGFFEKAVALQTRFAKGKTVRNIIQTNGLLIDENWASFLKQNEFLVGISIDGPADIHDTHRVARNGKGVHDKVVTALELLKKHDVAFNILAVVNATSAQHPREVYDYLTKDLGATFVQFIPAVEQRLQGTMFGALLPPQTESHTAEVTDWSVSGQAYGEFMIGVFDEWVRRDVGRVFVQMFDNALATWLGERASLCVMQPTCGSALVIEMNGDVYSCDHYVYPEHRLGNIKRDNLASMISNRKQKAFGMAKADLPKKCLQCSWRFACHGGCPKHRIHNIKGKWHNHLCEGYMAIFSHMDPYMRYMAEQIHRQQSPASVMSFARSIGAQT